MKNQTYKSIIQGLEKDKKEISKKSKAFRQNDTTFVDKAIKFLKMLEKEGIPAGQISQVDFVTNRVPKFFVGNPQRSPSFSKFTPNDVKKAVAHAKKIGILEMKNDERTHEIGTDEYREYLQQNTPQQEVEKYVNEAQKKMNSEKKKHFSQVFQNPLKGFPYNEEFEVTEKDLNENVVSELFANPDATEEDRLDPRTVKKFKKLHDELDKFQTFVIRARDMNGSEQRSIKKRISEHAKELKFALADSIESGSTLVMGENVKHVTDQAIEDTVNELDALDKMQQTHQENADKSLQKKADKSGVSVATLKKVYKRGVAAWKTGHRPGTTPEQWGHARVNAFLVKRKKGNLNHDKDLA